MEGKTGGKINILGFAGSLRKGSYNKALLRAALELIPEDATLETFDLEGIPPFNQDLEASMPERVKEFKYKIKSADAIVIATPDSQLFGTWSAQERHRLGFATSWRQLI
jgi:chromate reductase